MAPKNNQHEKERAFNAMKEMKACGFPAEKTKAVLKGLLKSFDNNWELIENENYSVLVDALISSDDVQGPSDNRTNMENGVGIGVKRNQKRKLDDSSSLHNHAHDAMRTDPTHAVGSLNTERIERSALQIKGKGIAIDSSQDNASTISPTRLSRSERSRTQVQYKDLENNDRASDGVHDSPRFEPPIAVMHPSIPFTQSDGSGPQHLSGKGASGSSGDAIMQIECNIETKATKEIHSSHNKLDQGGDGYGIAGLSSSTEIASSPNGKIKLSLSWKDMDGNFCMPRLDTILKIVEERCLKSYRVLQPNFSLMNVMTEICQVAIELGQYNGKTNPNSRTEAAGRLHTHSLVVGSVGPHEPSLGDIRPSHDVSDITKGEEGIKIAVVNDVGSKQFPPPFFYISHNMVYQNGHVNFSLARIGDEDCCSDCFGDCLSASLPCPCTRETGGEFAYNMDGIINKKFLDDYTASIHSPQNHHLAYCKDCPLERSKNEVAPEPCKGHLVRKFIKECWVKCGCNKLCGNRVVQRGITRNLQVFFTGDLKGWGLRTLEELPRGAFVCEYIGEVLTNMELYDRTIKITGNAAHTYPVLLDADWGSEGILKDEEALCLDATFYGNVARFINHRCYDANLIEIPVEIETADRHYYHLAFFTTRKVEPLEELTWDYGIDFDDHSHPVKSFGCKCGSKYCRDMKRSSRSKTKALVVR